MFSTDNELSSAEESWVKTPSKKKGDVSKHTPTSRGGSSQRRTDVPSMISSISTPSPRRNKTQAQASAKPTNNSVKRSHTYPITPSISPATPSSTPTSRMDAIETALNQLSIDPTSPTPAQRKTPVRKYVVVVSSDEGESDVDMSDIPTRASSFREEPSSHSSMNSLFSTISATSSTSSIGSNIQPAAFYETKKEYCYFDNILVAPPPQIVSVAVRDVFNMGSRLSSPNVTGRKPQKPDHKSLSSPSPIIPSVTSSESAIPEPILHFAQFPFGTDLDEVIIAHCETTQKLLDDNKIEWGVQYELARGVTAGLWTWNEVKEHIPALRGKNSEAAFKVQKLMRRKEPGPPSDMSLWMQLDREQAAIKEKRGRGLGLMGEFEGASDWYGGKIQQHGRLIKDGQHFGIKLERMESRRSHRFARFYGSRRFLHVRVPDDFWRENAAGIKKYLKSKFILCGRVFVPFHPKDGKVYLVETDENWGRESQEWCADDMRCTFNDFVNWHNPIEENWKQVMSKYVTRFALGLSNSTPALEFQKENIHFIDDITAEDWPQDKKNAPADKLMTDGCGFINHTALLLIVKQNGYESLPAGVQGRIDGSKGFWILHPTDTSTAPMIWIRESQNKIKNRKFDRAHCIFDLLCASQPSSSIAITQQSIMNLFANGIPGGKLVKMMEQGLEDEVMPLLEWKKPHAMTFLADAINKSGGIPGAKAQRVAYSLNRVLGLKGREWHDVDDGGTEPDEQELPAAGISGRNTHSGAPLALHELAVELIQAGFHPAENKLLQEKIAYIVQTVIKTSVEKYRIPIANSLGAFIVPDPLGILKEGEVCYRFSRPRKDPKTEMLCYALEGEILVGRYPIRLPSDMQKVIAVDRRELDKWPDVLIISTQGKRSIASLLADGDMDGDEIIAIFDQDLVDLFDNKPFTSPPQGFMEQNFDRDVEKVEQFCNRVQGMSRREVHEAFQEALISNLGDSKVGLYSMMHEKAVVKCGYGHPDSVRLAYIFATLLDSSKSGRRLKPGIFQKDSQIFGPYTKGSNDTNQLTDDILEILKAAGKSKGDELLEKYRTLVNPDESNITTTATKKDKELLLPYQLVNDQAMTFSASGIKNVYQELQIIRDHVKTAHELFKRACSKHFAKKGQDSPTKKTSKSFRAKEKKDDVMLECSRKFWEPLEGIKLILDVDFVKASFAYDLSEKFAFTVAFQTLCHIKARASPGGIAPSTRVFDEAKTFSSSYLRALTRAEEEANDFSRF